MKVLLAEDNPLLLEHFANMVDWKQYGFDVVLKAEDGKRAWQKFEAYHPELVIADIQMPRMTGIELGERIREKSAETILYFLTSYEEFSYVKSALELGSCGYLLKHEMNRVQMIRILEEAGREIKKRKRYSRYDAEAAFTELVWELERKNGEEIHIEEYSAGLPDVYDLFWVEQDHRYPVVCDVFGIQESRADEKAVAGLCYQAVPQTVAAVQAGDWFWLCLVKTQGGATEQAYDLKLRLREKFGSTFSVLILAEQEELSGCVNRYLRTKEVRRQGIFRVCSCVLHAEDIGRSRKVALPLDLEKADRWIRDREFEKLCRWMDQNFLKAVEARDGERFEALTRYFSVRLMEYHEKLVNLQTGVMFTVCESEDTANWYEASVLYHWMKHKVMELGKILENPSVFQYSDIVNRAVLYVSRNYTNSDLSVEEIASHLKISANHLNTVFRKETGETLWKFVVRVRMERAKELLNLGRDKMTDICRKTGYKNISYFSKVFRETCGMTPMEYRREHSEI